MYRITIDPGHGGYDPGAVGPTKLKEKDVNIAVAKHVSVLLSPYMKVKLTRETDIASDLVTRARVANEFGAMVFVSIHCNSSEDPHAYGMEVFTMPGQGPADKLAEKIITRWGNAFPGMVIRRDLSDGDSDKEARFRVLTKTNMPAVLVEMAFISNPEEERLLASQVFQEAAAMVIAEAVASFFGVYLHLQPSPSPSAVSPEFKDVRPDRWSAAAITRLVQKGILHGYPDGTFQPERPVTREELAIVANAILEAR